MSMLGIILQAATDVAPAVVDLLPLAKVGGAIGASVAAIGAGLGIGKLASASMESTARQPEVAGDLRTNMLLSAAFIEGVALFAIVVCLLVVVM